MSSDPDFTRRPDERTDAREQTVIVLYEAEQRAVSPLSILAEGGIASEELSTMLVTGVHEAKEAIDQHIISHAKGWSLERMPALDRAILRLAIFELMSRPDVPIAVVIDEAVELAKRFSTDDSGRFVNGVLSAVAQSVRPSGD